MLWKSYVVEEQIHIKEFYSFFDDHYDKEFRFTGESHDFWECVYVVDGSVYIAGDERVYHLEKGHLIFHKPLEFHKFHIENKEGATLLVFSFSMDGVLTEYLKEKVFELSDSQKDIVHSLLNYVHNTWIRSQQKSPVREYKYLVHEHATPIYIQMLTTYICQLFLSLINNGQMSSTSTETDAKIFQNAVNYINTHIEKMVSVEEIAANCFVSISSLKRVFRKYAGISIHKYVLTLKIKAATVLLYNGASVTQTAEGLGFSSQAYFSSCYKRETGQLPTAVRKDKKYLEML